MSDSLIAFQPAIDEPSNMMPSVKLSSLMVSIAWARCCHLPRGSVKRRSTYLTSFYLIRSRTFFGSAMASSCLVWSSGSGDVARSGPAPSPMTAEPAPTRAAAAGALPGPLGFLDRLRAALAGADADRLLDGG